MSSLSAVCKRGRLVTLFLAAAGLVFAGRAIQIQIIQHHQYDAYARSQQQSAMPLKAMRGTIYDREGRVLAYDMEAATYTVSPRHMKDRQDSARKLAKLT